MPSFLVGVVVLAIGFVLLVMIVRWLFPLRRQLTPGPRENAAYVFEAELTVEQWRESAILEEGSPEYSPWVCVGMLACTDDRDTGTLDRWELRFTARPIVEDPKREGTWRLASPIRVQWKVPVPLVRKREYWLSQTAKQRLPEPVYENPSKGRSRRWLPWHRSDGAKRANLTVPASQNAHAQLFTSRT